MCLCRLPSLTASSRSPRATAAVSSCQPMAMRTARGFYLRDGGYYFAMNDKWDLKLLGEIYTKGFVGLSAASNYRKRYKYSVPSSSVTRIRRHGDKGMPDFTEQESFKVQWSHRQDQQGKSVTVRCRQVSTSPHRAMSATISTRSIIRRR